jgi:flagellar motor switch protein FliM
MRLADVVNLRLGQRIVLNAVAGAAVQVRCGAVHLFDGHVGRRQNRVAVRIDGPMRRAAAPAER